jgi:hypothetical protein
VASLSVVDVGLDSCRKPRILLLLTILVYLLGIIPGDDTRKSKAQGDGFVLEGGRSRMTLSGGRRKPRATTKSLAPA